ncbi:MAG: ATP-binding protein [Pseudomonadota bacterium]
MTTRAVPTGLLATLLLTAQGLAIGACYRWLDGAIVVLAIALVATLGTLSALALARRSPSPPPRGDDTFQLSAMPMFRATVAGEITQTNAALREFLRLSGHEADDFSTLNLAEPVAVSTRRLTRRNRAGGMRTKETVFTSDGEAKDVILYVRLAAPDVAEDRRVEGAAIDMTEFYSVKRAVRASRERFRRLYDETPVALLCADSNGIITDVNSFLLNRFDVERTAIVGQPLVSLITRDRRDHALQQIVLALDSGVRSTTDTECLVSVEHKFPARMYLNPRPARSSSGEALMVTLFDLTEIRQAETERDHVANRLRVAERLEAVGQLAFAVAHEVNTPSQYVIDNLEFLQEACDAMGKGLRAALPEGERDDDLQYYLDEYAPAIEQSLDGMRHIKKIVGAMSRLTDPVDPSDRAPTDLNELIENVAMLARGECPPTAELAVNLDQELQHTPCDPSAIHQALLNLLRNAAQAVADKGEGTIRISTRQGEQQAELVIEDTGCGIAPENLDRVINPFFTTRELGEGTGQGLSIAHRIVTEEHEGTLDLESEHGAWTRLTIRLPQSATREAA